MKVSVVAVEHAVLLTRYGGVYPYDGSRRHAGTEVGAERVSGLRDRGAPSACAQRPSPVTRRG